MRRRLLKAIGYTVLALLVLVAGAAAAVSWRLSQGPLAITFLTPTVQDTINASLSGMQVQIGDVIIERDQDSGRPRFRLRDIRLRDADGNMIARAPRAAVEVNGRALLTGNVVPEELALIGPRIMARRLLDGTIQLGFGGAPADNGGTQNEGKRDRADAPEVVEAVEEEQAPVDVWAVLRRDVLAEEPGSSLISSVMAVRITQASVSIYDEANDALWFAPKANFVFRRMPYGFALFADAIVASGKEPWRTEIVANYRAADRRFTLSARLFDLIPADLSDEVFALTQFAQMRLPLSGHAEVEFTDTGVVTKASAELTAAAGKVGFPDYVSEPLLIDEGLLRFDYDPATGDVLIGDSAIFIGGSQAQLSGRIQSLRDDGGRLKALKLAINARNVAIDAEGAVKNPLLFEQVDFTGIASLDEAKLEVEDLVLLSGKAGMRVRGRFLGEDEGIGVYLAGGMRDVTANMVKKLWPPIVAPGARQWFGKNIIDGRIPEGAFQIALPAKMIAAALRDEIIPDELVKSEFSIADVKARYFGELPPLEGAHGKATMTGNNFRVVADGGFVTLGSGKRVELVGGTIAITDLAARESPGEFNVEATSGAREFLELIDYEPLRLATRRKIDPDRFAGNVRVKLKVSAPLSRFITEDEVTVGASARLEDGVFKAAVQGTDLTDLNLDITVSEEALEASGPAKVNGVGVRLAYARGVSGPETLAMEATLDADERTKLGVDLSDYLAGSTPVKLKAEVDDGRVLRAHVEADLSAALLKLDAIAWKRGATKATKAVFDLDLRDAGAIAITDLSLTGQSLKIAGDIRLGADGRFREAKFSSFRLDEVNDLELALKQTEGLLAIRAAGDSFDARPLIGNLFSPSSESGPRADQPAIEVTASIGRVFANRGEVISGVAGTLRLTGGQVERADLRGQHADGSPVSLQIAPNAQGLRELRIVGRDGGAVLRASNLYSKIAGGTLEFWAILGAGSGGTIQKGRLVVRNFQVVNEEALTSIDSKAAGAQKKAVGPRRESQFFSKLTLPFSVDAEYVRIGDALIRSVELGATAQGIIRKADGAMDIGGTIIPAYALNAALGEVPIVGEILMGGKGQGLFGLNYALKGTMREPRFLVNPVSAIAPGFLRHLFGIGGASGIAADGTVAPPPRPRESNR